MVDVLIVGGGVMGCTLAYRLAKTEHLSVLVLEKSVPGAEASSAAAGMLGAQMEAHTSGPFLEFCLYSRDLFKTFAEELLRETEIHIGYRECGILEVAHSEKDAERLIARYQWQKKHHLEIEMLDPPELLKMEPHLSPQNFGALFYPKDHQVDAMALAKATSCAAHRAGVHFLSGKTVERLAIEHQKIQGVFVENELIPAPWVIIAAGAWTSQIPSLPPLRSKIRPIRGQIALLEARPPILQHTLVDTYGYLVPRADGRILIGSTMESVGFQKHVTAGGILHLMSLGIRLVPALKEVPFIGTWAGFRPSSDDGSPLIGPTSIQGLWVVSGHHRNGILLVPGTAEIILNLFRGKKMPFDTSIFLP
ncbi:MAG: glycine oxidase ThiO [Planctomycetota bacterium]